MSSAPEFVPAGEALYERMAPWATYDPDRGYALAWLCATAGLILDDVYAFTQLDWDGVMDPDTAPVWFLPHLAMWAGVRFLPEGLTDAQQRARVRSTDGMRRCTPQAIIGAARQHLTGLQRVVLKERYDPAAPTVDKAYHFTVMVYDDECPNPALVEAALLEQKPVGHILHFVVIEEDVWDQAAGTWNSADPGVTWDNYTP